jgi:hypothetical protein
MAGEYNNNSRNFANENKLGKKMVVVVTLVAVKSCDLLGAIRHLTSFR